MMKIVDFLLTIKENVFASKKIKWDFHCIPADLEN